MDDEISLESKCLYQVFPQDIVKITSDGWGYCKDCLTDEKNLECKGYISVNVKKYEVKSDDYCKK